MKISEMRNLGPASEKMLNKVGVKKSEDLIKIGPNEAFKLLEEKGLKPNTNFLYAMIGAVTDRSWLEVVNDFKKAGMLKKQERKN